MLVAILPWPRLLARGPATPGAWAPVAACQAPDRTVVLGREDHRLGRRDRKARQPEMADKFLPSESTYS